MRNLPDAIVLCGGAGLRLRSVAGTAPKSMSMIDGRPFLELLLRQLRRHGFQHVILAVGYQKDVIRSHFGERAFDLSLEYSEETSPLGTGGALRSAADLIKSESVLTMNGDSYTDADLCGLVADHGHAGADASVVVVQADQRSDCGLVSVEESGRVIRFSEKRSLPDQHYVNAGIYMVTRSVVCEIPAGLKISLEEDVFPQWLADGKYVRAFVHPGICVDIGTPERYRSAQTLLAHAEVDQNRISE